MTELLGSKSGIWNQLSVFNNSISRVVEECEVRFFLYDADEGKAFSEAGQINLTGNSSFSSFRFLFTVRELKLSDDI